MNKRSPRFPELRDRYDLIIIGGGIYGATLAWEAASRGLSVVLLEKGDFCSATSANSLKVIHGGIRYLQTLDFARIKESVRERRALLRIAPHLVSPMECVMPTYRELSKSKLALWGGMKLYDFLSQDRNNGLDTMKHIPQSGLLSLSEFQSILPDLQDSRITGGARWYDAQVFNSERLVLAFLMSAREKGAHVINYLESRETIVKDGEVNGVLAEDCLTNVAINIVGNTVIDCTGPWTMSDLTFGQAKSKAPPRMARAVNLIVKRKVASCAVGIKTRLAEDAATNNRLLFATPWREGSLIGTWYFPDTGAAEDQKLTDTELETCIAQVNSVFPSLDISKEDVTRVHLGRLPADSVCARTGEPEPRKDFKIVSAREQGGPSGLYWVQGVKYTTARDVAMRTLEVAAQRFSGALVKSRTHEIPLYGGDMLDMSGFLASCHRYIKYFSQETINHLVNNYGTKVDDIVRYVESDATLAEPVPGMTDTIKAELSYIIDNEMVFTLSDLILRRTDIGSFAIPRKETIDYCAHMLAQRLDWDQARKSANVKELLDQYPEWVK